MNKRLIRVVGEQLPEEDKYVGSSAEAEYFRVRPLDQDTKEFYYSEEHYLRICPRLQPELLKEQRRQDYRPKKFHSYY